MKFGYNKIFFYFIFSIFITLGLSISSQSLLAAWTAPLNNPPVCNAGDPGCDAPLNAGPLIQTKSGALWINTNGISPLGFIVQSGKVGVGTTSPLADLANAGSTYLQGNVGIGTKDTSTYKLNVEGDIFINRLIFDRSYNTYGSAATYPIIYSTNSTGGTEYPFLEHGNLIIQARDGAGSLSRDIVFVAGETGMDRGVKMNITRAGNVGIGTIIPLGRFNVNDGPVVFSGTYGATPISGAGTRLMWVPAKAALRAGIVTGAQWDNTNIGNYSVALGRNPVASGDDSIALGRAAYASYSNAVAIGFSATSTGTGSVALGTQANASNGGAIAIGGDTIASGYSAISIGSLTNASGNFSTALGWSTNANSFGSMAVGTNNVGGGTPDVWVSTDPIFEIGNGQFFDANAMTVLKNGNVGIGTTTPANKLEVNGSARFSSLRIDGLAVFGGGTGLPPATGAGKRFVWAPNGAALRAGRVDGTQWDGVNLGDYSIAFGYNTIASGNYSMAIGSSTKANSEASLAVGRYNVGGGSASAWVATDPIFEIGIGSGPASLANALTVLKNGDIGIGIANPAQTVDMKAGGRYGYNGQILAQADTGRDNWSFGRAGNLTMTGDNNTAVGALALSVNASGYYNTAIGSRALAGNVTGYYNVAMGKHALEYNTAGFQNVGLGGDVLYDNASGNNNVAVGYSAGRGITSGSGNTILGAGIGGLAAGLTNNIILASGQTVRLQFDGTNWNFSSGNVGVGTTNPGTYNMYINGTGYLNAAAWVYGSDRRLKENIIYFNGFDSLGKIILLKPARFDYFNGEKNQLGFIAQDVQVIIPEAVVTDKATGMLGLKTDFIIPHLVQAIKELAATLESLAAKVENLFNKYLVHENRIQSLEKINLEQQKQINELKNQLEIIKNRPE